METQNKSNEVNEPLLDIGSDGSDELTQQKAFDLTGGFGMFQVILVISLFISFSFQGFISYNLYLFELEPEYTWQFHQNSTFAPCSARDRYDAIEWKLDESRNNLNLDNWYTRLSFDTVPGWKIGMIGSVYFIGYIGGSLYFPRLADIHGRKPFVVIGAFLQSIWALLLFFSNSLEMIYFSMFMIGIASPLLSSIGYNYLIEFIPESSQNSINTALMCIDALSSLIGILYFTYISHSINLFLITCAVLGFSASLIHTLTPESPIFYLSIGKYDEARDTFQTIGNFNRANFPKNKMFQGEQSVLDVFSPDHKENPTSMLDFVKDKTLLINIIVMTCVWSWTSSGYYLINFYMKYFGGTVINNVVANVSSEIIGSLFASVIFEFVGAKPSLMIFFLISGLSGLFFCFGFQNTYIITALILITKFGVAASYCIIYITTARIFPAKYSSTAFGICNIFARIITAMIPMIIELPPPSPMLFLTISFLAVWLMIRFLKESEEEEESLEPNKVDTV